MRAFSKAFSFSSKSHAIQRGIIADTLKRASGKCREIFLTIFPSLYVSAHKLFMLDNILIKYRILRAV